MEPALMADSIPMDQSTMALFSSGGEETWSAIIVVLVAVFYLLLYVGLPLLIIFSARANWRALHERETVVEFVGFWRRIAICLVDGVLSAFIVPLFFNLYYYLRDGQTIAGKIYGAKLVDKKSLKTASVGQLFIRKIAKILSALPLGLGFMMAGWRAEKLAWHDGLSDVRYISYKKVHGFWTWFPFLVAIVLPIIVTIAIGAINGYQDAGMRAAEMAM